MSSMKISHFVPMLNKHGRHRQLFFFDWSISKNLLWNCCPNKLEIGTKHIYKVHYDDCSFSFYLLTSMAATGNSCFWLVNFCKSSPLKLLAQNELQLGGNHLWNVLYQYCSYHPNPFINISTTGNSCFWSVDF